MNIPRIDKCPYCGSRNIGEGYHDGYACVRVKGSIFKTSQISYLICADCGAILHSRVDKPHIFMPKERD